MDDKRTNNSIWRISVPEDEKPATRIEKIVADYRKLVATEDGYAPLLPIPVAPSFSDVTVTVYIRARRGSGLYSFLSSYMLRESDRKQFNCRAVDAIIFFDTGESLFAVTSGSAYYILENYADYSFPFEVARRLMANRFKAADVRQITGSTTSRMEIYRRGQSISNSEALGKVWKRLVGRLNSSLLEEGSYLAELIDPSRPPTIEVKSSLVLKKSLSLEQLAKLVKDLEYLPEVNEEQRREFSFLDNLYQVNIKTLVDELNDCLIENLRMLVIDPDRGIDLDLCDPEDVSRYYGGNRYKFRYWPMDGEPPELINVVNIIQQKFANDEINDSKKFLEKIAASTIRYNVDVDAESPTISKPLLKFLHGQIEYDGGIYFHLDKIWYQVRGDFLEKLNRDFIDEVFHEMSPILLSEGPEFLGWKKGDDEDAFNISQAKKEGFYYGDKIFAVTDRGKVELFDLLYVDHENRQTYVIHVKSGFDAKMRDACSQISMSAEIIEQDVRSQKSILRDYYISWKTQQPSWKKRASEAEFLRWFSSYSRVYVVLASTNSDFSATRFERGEFKSHIARREILAVRNELRTYGYQFNLAHTRKM
jgi:uncharacterized protein (TIGR04141 family)